MDITYYCSQIFQGIATGSLYGLVGLSMMFIYRSARVFNFAQGEMATATVFVAWVLLGRMHPAFAIVLALGFGFLLGCVIEFGVIKLLRRPTESNMAILTIGVYTIINSVDAWSYGDDPVTFPALFPSGGFTAAGVFFSYQSLGTLGCIFILSLALYLLFKFTIIGAAFQAMAEDRMAARLKGVRVGLLVTMAWGISSVFGAIAGMLMAPSLLLHPNLMTKVLLYAFAASAIGGLQTSFGALVGGALIGVTENLAGAAPSIGSELKTAVVFGLIILFLAVRPRGLFGRDEPRKI